MRDKLDMLIAESMAIEAEDAKQAGAVGFTARALTQATLDFKPLREAGSRKCPGDSA